MNRVTRAQVSTASAALCRDSQLGELFPSGVQMTGELLADLEQWARLTGKPAARGSTAP